MNSFCPHIITRIVPLILLAFLAGCERREVKVYEAPTDAAASVPPTPMPAGHPPIGNAATLAEEASDKPQWTLPAKWTEQPPTQMLLAKFSTQREEGRADITVSSFAGEMGGMLRNVNRWRGQVSLPPIGEGELAPLLQKFEVDSNVASMVEFEGTSVQTEQPARLICVAVLHEGRSWFFKILGDVKAIAAEKETFIKFVQSV